MKTNELIKLLQQEDPNNECDVCVGNHPVSGVDQMPYYWDGRLERIIKDDDGKPIKGGYPSDTRKIKIHYDTLEDALMDNPEMELDLSGITYEGKVCPRHASYIENWKEEGRKYQQWHKSYVEAHKQGKEPPSFSSDKLTWRDRLGDFLRRLRLIT